MIPGWLLNSLFLRPVRERRMENNRREREREREWSLSHITPESVKRERERTEMEINRKEDW